MASVHPQDTLDVPLAARRKAAYDCEFVLDVEPQPLGRLVDAVDRLIAVTAHFEVGTDDYGRPRVNGQAQATVLMPCQRCLEGVRIEVTAPLGQVIWFGDKVPEELSHGDQDVMVSSTREMSFAALVEDDLLLALPQQVCQVDDCERLPVLAYPAPGYTSAVAGSQRELGEGDSEGSEGSKGNKESSEATDAELPDDRQRPFSGLKDLLKSQSEE